MFPGNITLSGPSSELNKVATCTAEVTYSGELTESITLNTPLRFYTSGGKEVKFEYTELEENSVDVTLQVYKMATLPVDVNFINAPRDFDDFDAGICTQPQAAQGGRSGR